MVVLSSNRKPRSIRSDKGSEFKNKEVRNFSSQKGIHTYYSQNETKRAVVERVIRTVKSILHRYFRHKQTYRYLHVLQDFVQDYNHRPHRPLGQFRPADVNQENASEVRYNAYTTKKSGVRSAIWSESHIYVIHSKEITNRSGPKNYLKFVIVTYNKVFRSIN